MACGSTDFICQAKQGIKEGISDAAAGLFDNILDFFSDQMVDAIGSLIESLGTMWVDIPTVDLVTGPSEASTISQGEKPDGANSVQTLMENATWISLGICVLSLIVLGAMLAISRSRGEGAGHVRKIGIVLLSVSLMSGAASIVSSLLGTVKDTGATGPAAFIQNGLWWYMGAAAVMSVIIGAAKMAWEQRAEPGKDLVKSLLTLVIVAGAGLTFVNLAVHASDEFSVWILDKARGGKSFAENMTVMVTVGVVTSPLLTILLGIFAIFFSFMQMMLMIVRSGMLVILAGVLPLAASFTNTGMGKSWFNKSIGWLVSFILYKPAAAIIYAAAFQLMNTSVLAEDDTNVTLGGAELADDTGVIRVITGLTMMVIALIAMPALIKFTAPMVGAMAGGSAVGASMASQSTESQPTGAKPTSGGRGGGQSGGASPSGAGGGSGGGKAGASATQVGGEASSAAKGVGAGSKGAGTAGAQSAGTAGAKAGIGAAAGAATAGTATAVMATAKAAKKVGEKAGEAMKEAAESSSDGGEGPSGSR